MQDDIFIERVKKVISFYHQKRRMPSYSEIVELLGFSSKNASYKFVQKLIKLNLVEKDEKGKLTPKRISNYLRVLGVIEAGFPSPAEEELIDTLSLERWLISNPTSTFILKVKGDSMLNAGILPGDMVLVDRSLNPKSGDIVIAEVDGQWTMKYFIKKGDEITLAPANPKYKPIKPKSELKIGGVVISVIRKLR
ncbi:MAG: transcriptional repressor LexA [Thermodesulfovibrio sp.]|nr:transcriptional repressor LexA [Thermodesulfovibrio sp.]MDW7999059.1 transcriptional repressor LexA [Thermodesulfovibrio sp.]